MTTPILPSAAQNAVSQIDSTIVRGVNSIKSTIQNIERNLTKTVDADKKPVTQEDILAAGADRYANLLQLVATLKAAVNLAAPGTYPAA